MDHNDHVNLLREGIPQTGGVWADIGSGTGAFTLALADLLGPSGTIHSVEKDHAVIRQQQAAMRLRFPTVHVRYITADFTEPLDLPPLDGIVMANALHFVKNKAPLLTLLRSYLKPGGIFILVEYNADTGNNFVPHPISYATWETLSVSKGLKNTRQLHRVPSRFLREIYSAVSQKPG